MLIINKSVGNKKFMTLLPKKTDQVLIQRFESFSFAKAAQENVVWEKLGETSVSESIDYWLSTLCYRTRINYESGMRKLSEAGLIHPLMSLQEFALVNHEAVVDKIKLLVGLSECTRQARAACYISFTNFLSRRSSGIVRKAMPC
jgi:integrase/recombinase XerD